MVASIRTCRRALPTIWSRNSRTRACCLPVARTLMTPVSGLAMTDAASRNTAGGAAAAVRAAARGAAVAEAGSNALTKAAPVLSAGATAGVARSAFSAAMGAGTLLASRNKSRIFSVSVAQNRLLEVIRIDAEDVLPVPPPLAPAPEPRPVVATCDSEPVLLRESRVMFG